MNSKLSKGEFLYAIVQNNNPQFAQESSFIENFYEDKKYALIIKHSFKDGTEKNLRIAYSDSLEEISNEAKTYPSWYIYPIGIYMELQGVINFIP